MEKEKTISFSKPKNNWETNNSTSTISFSQPANLQENISEGVSQTVEKTQSWVWSQVKEWGIWVFVPKEWQFAAVKPDDKKIDSSESKIVEENKTVETKKEEELIPPESTLALMDERAIVKKGKWYVYVKKDWSFITLKIPEKGMILLLPKNRKKKPFYKTVHYHYYLHVNVEEMEDLDVSMNNRRIWGTYAWKSFERKYSKDYDVDPNLISDVYYYEIIFRKKNNTEKKIKVKGNMKTISTYALALLAYYWYEEIISITAVNFEKNFWESIFIKQSNKYIMPPKELFLFTRKLWKKYRTNPSGAEVIHLREMIHELDVWPSRNTCIRLVEYMEENNKPLADVLYKIPENFDTVYQSVVKIWHTNGKMAEAFENLADITERQYELGRVIKKALRSPILTIIIMFIVIVVSVFVSVPIIEDVYTSFKVEVPPLTLALKAFVYGSINYWYIAIVTVIATTAAYSFWANNTMYWRKFMADLKLTYPIFWEFLKKRDYEVLTAIAALIYSQWDDLAIILHKLKKVVQNFHISWVINTAALNWEDFKTYPGVTFAKYEQYIDTKIASAWKTAHSPVAEFETLTQIYRWENDDFVENLQKFLEPVLMMMISLLLLIIIFGIIFPLYNLVNVIK